MFFTPKIHQISVTEAKKLLENKEAIMLDVRRTDEREESFIPESIWITLGELDEASLTAKGIKNTDKVILQCRSGGRSQKAAKAMLKWGYENVSNLEGGIMDWVESGYIVCSE
jgi:rhodanese-related sulfurtransferase